MITIAQARKWRPGFFYRREGDLLLMYTKRRRLYRVYDNSMDEFTARLTVLIMGVQYAGNTH